MILSVLVYCIDDNLSWAIRKFSSIISTVKHLYYDCTLLHTYDVSVAVIAFMYTHQNLLYKSFYYNLT